MKRTIRLLALILTLTLALSAAAMAENINYDAGKKNEAESVSAVSLVDGCELEFVGDSDKLKVTYTDAALQAGDMVAVFLLQTDDKKEITDASAELSIVPTVNNITYIDQSTAVTATTATAEEGKVTFEVYPQNHTNSVIWLIGAHVNKYVATLKLLYTLGNVNGDTTINALDSLAILKYLSDNSSFPLKVPAAADANGDGMINALDSLAILKYLVDNDSFPLGKKR